MLQELYRMVDQISDFRRSSAKASNQKDKIPARLLWEKIVTMAKINFQGWREHYQYLLKSKIKEKENDMSVKHYREEHICTI